MKTSVIVVTHKPFDDSVLGRNIIGYRVVKVGKGMCDTDAQRRGWLCDNMGDNISDENPYYCELTALYWNWKNRTENITGLVHYRRYFVNYRCDSKCLSEDILAVSDMAHILQKKKIILPFPFIKVPNCAILYRNKPKAEQDLHWLLLEEIIHESHPDYIEAFEHVIYDSQTTYYLNMFITTREIMNEYCVWLFDVLKRYDQKIAARGEERLPRVDGFLSETLLHIWVAKRFKKNEIYWMPVYQVLDLKQSYYSNSSVARLKRWLNAIRPYYYLKNKGDLLLQVMYRIYTKSIKCRLRRLL